MAGTSDIALIGLVALMLSDKLGGLNLGGLLGKTDSDPQVEIKTTESISCRCSDGFKMKQFPVVMANGIIHNGTIAGKLKGVMPATTPNMISMRIIGL